MRTFAFVSLLLFLAVTGCAANRAMMVHQDEAPMPTQDEALIVFLTPAGSTDVRAVTIHDVTGKDVKFVGLSQPGSKMTHRIKPGQHLFMVSFTTSSFLQVNAAAGRTYYAVVTMDATQGIMNRYTLRAVKQRDFEDIYFVRLNRNAALVAKNKAAEEWGAARASAYAERKERLLPAWLAQAPGQREPHTLQTTDGR